MNKFILAFNIPPPFHFFLHSPYCYYYYIQLNKMHKFYIFTIVCQPCSTAMPIFSALFQFQSLCCIRQHLILLATREDSWRQQVVTATHMGDIKAHSSLLCLNPNLLHPVRPLSGIAPHGMCKVIQQIATLSLALALSQINTLLHFLLFTKFTDDKVKFLH